MPGIPGDSRDAENASAVDRFSSLSFDGPGSSGNGPRQGF